MSATSVIDGWRQPICSQHLADSLRSLFDLPPQLIIKDHFFPSARSMVVDGATRNRLPSHLFQTQRLGTELQIVVPPLPAWTTLILDGVGHITPELHDVSPSN